MQYAKQKPLPSSRESLMEEWRQTLTNDAVFDPSDVVIAELSEYFKLSPEEVREKCLNWEKYSLEEWQAKDRTSPEGLADFYQTQVSWIFDTMWYHAQQSHENAPAESVEIVLGLHHLPPGEMLDFGAGPGSSVMFFSRLGWKVSYADISTTMLDFARWRLDRHKVQATFYNTRRDTLPTGAFDLITAFDVMVHVPDIGETLTQLHRALKPGGYLIFNIDNRPLTLENHGHLYEEQWPILGKVRRIGFSRRPKITYFHVYQKVEQSNLRTAFITIFDQLRYNRYITFVGNGVRALKRRLLR